jgi:predicted  nucleic acid-binding Zn-ribbon protein
MMKRIEQNDKKEEITLKKINELGNLLEESQKIIKDYEMENRQLKQEIEIIKYRYNLLKASIDTVEYKIKTES